MAMSRPECCFLDVSWIDLDLVVSLADINLVEHLRAG